MNYLLGLFLSFIGVLTIMAFSLQFIMIFKIFTGLDLLAVYIKPFLGGLVL